MKFGDLEGQDSESNLYKERKMNYTNSCCVAIGTQYRYRSYLPLSMEKDVKVKVLECVTLLKMTLLFENTPNNRTEPNFPITNLFALPTLPCRERQWHHLCQHPTADQVELAPTQQTGRSNPC